MSEDIKKIEFGPDNPEKKATEKTLQQSKIPKLAAYNSFLPISKKTFGDNP